MSTDISDEQIDAAWDNLPGIQIHNKANAQGLSTNVALHRAFARAILALAARPEATAAREPDMRAICEALGFDPTNHHNAAKCPYCRPTTPPVGTEAPAVAASREARELMLQHAMMDAVQVMNGCVMTSPTLQKAHELLRQALWDYSEAVRGTRKATDHTTLLVRALRSLETTEECHGSTGNRSVLMADIRSALAAPSSPRAASPEQLARRFHDAYERLAPTFGYTTRPDTREWSPESTNGQLMIAVCEELLAHGIGIAAEKESEA